MKKSLVVGLAVTLLTGCTTTVVETPYWSLNRKSFMQKIEIPDLSISTNGTAHLRGYMTDGGNQALAIAIDAAVTAAMKGAKP